MHVYKKAYSEFSKHIYARKSFKNLPDLQHFEFWLDALGLLHSWGELIKVPGFGKFPFGPIKTIFYANLLSF